MRRALVTGLLTLSLLASMLPANAAAARSTTMPETGLVQTVTGGETEADIPQADMEDEAEHDGAEQTSSAAEINGTPYDTLEAAIAAAEEERLCERSFRSRA